MKALSEHVNGDGSEKVHILILVIKQQSQELKCVNCSVTVNVLWWSTNGNSLFQRSSIRIHIYSKIFGVHQKKKKKAQVSNIMKTVHTMKQACDKKRKSEPEW